MNELTPQRARMLEECLRLLDGGASVEDCLSRYPDAAVDLRPFLELRASLTASGQIDPPTGAYEQGRSRLLSQLAAPPSVLAPASFWRGIVRFLSGEQRWGGGLARAAAGVVAVFVLGVGVLGVSAAGGFEPARQALEPARDVLSALRIVSDDKKDREVPDMRPTDEETDAPVDAEETREPARDEPTPTVCVRSSDRPCVDATRPTPTPGRDARATETPLRDARATATPVRDAPLRPGNRIATAERPLDVEPSDPPRDDEPAPTSPRDAEQSDRPLDDATNDTRSGEPVAPMEPSDEDPKKAEPRTSGVSATERLSESSGVWPADQR